MTNYRRGADFERRVCVDLTSYGWASFRSAGSRGVADVLGIRPGEVALIQCKTDGMISLAEWNNLWELAWRLNPGRPMPDPRRTVRPVLALKSDDRGIEYRLVGALAEHGRRRKWEPWSPGERADQ